MKLLLITGIGPIEEVLSAKGIPFEANLKSLVLITSQYGLEIAQSGPPYMKLIGPAISNSRKDPDPQLENILEDALKSEKSVIYLSLGTVVTMEPHNIEQLLLGLGRLNETYIILWSVKKHQQKSIKIEIPKNIQVFTNHVHQLYLLSHPSVKLFISHCGANSLIEALYYGVPILGLPVRGDQPGNADIAVNLGAGEVLDVSKLDATLLFETINKMLESPKYRQDAQKISTLLQMSNGAETGAREIELFAAIKDITPFIPMSELVPWYFRMNLDIYLFTLVLLFVVWGIISKCFCKGKNAIVVKEKTN